ncbi:hypothetical protein B0J18DRAFT_409373 [Chaetomium sp. MPI-SDFR-AT-0129]|nr:hypothetical protein B0J18DRAFT_409373 [Chaetomium sp. MPI-SDFR-AT-0129]
MAHHHNFPLPPPTVIPRSVLNPAHRNLDFGVDGLDADFDFKGPRPSSGLVPVPPSSGRLSDPFSSTGTVPIRPIKDPNNSLSISDDADLTGDGPRRLPLYYSKQTNNRRRNKQSYSATTAHAIKTARYPVLFEKLKAPVAARRALKTWKKRGMQGAVEENPTSALALETHDQQVQPLVEDGRTEAEADNNGSDQNTAVREPAEVNRRHQGEEAPSERSQSQTGSGNESIAPPPSTFSPVITPSTSTALVVGDKAVAANDLPPQYMTFSKPLLEKTRRGRRHRITCTLEKSYPNFHIECEYTYVDKSEKVNASRTDTRISCAAISTKENVWVVAFEQEGYNEEFIKGFVGEAEYVRLDGEGNGPIKGYSKSSDLATVKVTKKIRIPKGFDLGGTWCKATGFYEMRIYIPAKDYVQK